MPALPLPLLHGVISVAYVPVGESAGAPQPSSMRPSQSLIGLPSNVSLSEAHSEPASSAEQPRQAAWERGGAADMAVAPKQPSASLHQPGTHEGDPHAQAQQRGRRQRSRRDSVPVSSGMQGPEAAPMVLSRASSRSGRAAPPPTVGRELLRQTRESRDWAATSSTGGSSSGQAAVTQQRRAKGTLVARPKLRRSLSASFHDASAITGAHELRAPPGDDSTSAYAIGASSSRQSFQASKAAVSSGRSSAETAELIASGYTRLQ